MNRLLLLRVALISFISVLSCAGAIAAGLKSGAGFMPALEFEKALLSMLTIGFSAAALLMLVRTLKPLTALKRGLSLLAAFALSFFGFVSAQILASGGLAASIANITRLACL